MRSGLLFGLVASVIGVTRAASGQTCTLDELQKLKPTSPQGGANFGFDVSASASFLAVGSQNATVSVNQQGKVTVFDRVSENWVQAAELVAADPTSSAQFGTAVALSGTTIVIGAPGDDAAAADSGAVYVFERLIGSWWQTAKLVPSNVGNSSNAGLYVDIDGNRIVVGGNSRFWIFDRSGINWAESFTSSGGIRSVALTGDHVFWGNPSESGQSGAVHWWRLSAGTWTFAGKLPTSGLIGQDYFFGWSIAADGQRLVVGAPNGIPPQSPTGNRTGVAYTYAYDGQVWNYQTALKASDGQSSDYFGDSVAIAGDRIAVGAKWSDVLAVDSGSGYVFHLNPGWQQTHKLVQSDPHSGANAFASIDITLDAVVGGSPKHIDGQVGSAGAVYSAASSLLHYFQSYGTGCSGSGGFVPSLGMTGCPAPGGAVSLSISKGIGGSLAIVLFSLSPADIPIPNGCTLLVNPALPPTLTLPLFGAGAGNGAISITSAFPLLLSGYSFSMQAFAADPANSWGYSSSNGLTANVPP